MEANRDKAEKFLILAIAALNHSQLEKAWTFVKKADQLYATSQSKAIRNIILGHLKNSQRTHARNPQNCYTSKPRTEERPPEKKCSTPEYTAEQLEAVKRIRNCRNHYEMLMLTREATICDIKKAYKKLALLLHPDKNKAPWADEAFKAVVNAVAILTDPEKRRIYDLRTFKSNPNTGRNRANEQQQRCPRRHPPQYYQRCVCICCIHPSWMCGWCDCCIRRHFTSETRPSNYRPKNWQSW